MHRSSTLWVMSPLQNPLNHTSNECALNEMRVRTDSMHTSTYFSATAGTSSNLAQSMPRCEASMLSLRNGVIADAINDLQRILVSYVIANDRKDRPLDAGCCNVPIPAYIEDIRAPMSVLFHSMVACMGCA